MSLIASQSALSSQIQRKPGLTSRVSETVVHGPPSDLQPSSSEPGSPSEQTLLYASHDKRHQTLAPSPVNATASLQVVNAAENASHDPESTTSAFQDGRKRRHAGRLGVEAAGYCRQSRLSHGQSNTVLLPFRRRPRPALERRGGSVHAMACQTLSPAKSNGSLECLQEIQAMSEPMSKKERVASQTESRYL